MSSERALWNLTRKNLSPFGLLHRVENGIDKGTPDVNYLLRRRPHDEPSQGWLELKHEPNWMKRSNTKFSIASLKLEQVQFLEAWSKAGGRAWTLLQVDRDYLLLHPAHIRAIFEGQYRSQQVKEAASLLWKGPWPLASILDNLTG